MARLEIDLSVKGFTQGKKGIDGIVTSLEKLDDTIRLVDFDKLTKGITGIGGAFKSVSGNIKAFTSDISKFKNQKIDTNFASSKADVEKYRASLASLKAENQSLRNDLVKNKAAIDQQKIAFEQGRVAQQSHRTETARVQSEIVKLRLEQAKNRQQTVAAAGSYREAQQRLTALGKSIREAKGGFTSTSPAIRSQISEYNRLNGALKKFDASMGNHQRNTGNYSAVLNNALPQLAQYATVAGGVTLAFQALNDAKRTVLQFDSSLRNVEKTTGLTRGEVSALGDEFIRLSQNLGIVGANSLAQYATVAGQLGVKGTKDILAFTEALAKLETATNITGEEGGSEIARTLTLVDGGVQNVKAFGDEIVALGNNFAATEKEILGNAESISQNVGIYRIGRQEVLAFATATKSVGIEAELVGSTFNRTLAIFESAIRTGNGLESILKLIGGTQESLSKRFKEDASGVFVDFIGALNRVYKEGGSVNEQLEAIGVNAVRDQRVIQSLSANGYDVLTRALETSRNAVGALDQEFDTASQKLASQVGRVSVAWDNLILSIEKGDGAIGKFSASVAGFAADALNTLNRLVNSDGWQSVFNAGEALISPVTLSGKVVGETIASRILPGNQRGTGTQTPQQLFGGSYNFYDRQAKATESVDSAQKDLGETVVRNKSYWEDQVKSIKATIEAMDLAERGTKEWASAQAELAKAQSNLDAYSKKSLTGGVSGSGGKTQLELINEANEAISKGQVGSLRGVDAELLKIDNKYASIFDKINKISDSIKRDELTSVANVNKELEKSRVKLEGLVSDFRKIGFGTSGVTGLTNSALQSASISQLPLLQRNQDRFGSVYGRNAVSSYGADSAKEEERIAKVVERGLRSGFNDIFNSIDDLGSNFFEVFSGVFGKLASTVTNTFGQVISTQLGSLLNSRISSEDFNIAGLGSTGSKISVAGGGLLGGILSSQGQQRNNSGLTIAGGALSGAAAGLAFGPYGAAVGAVVGAIAGIFQSAGAKKQEKIQEQQLAEQRKQTAIQERQAALSYTSSIIGRMSNQGIVSGSDINEFGEVTFRIQGKDLVASLNRENNSR